MVDSLAGSNGSSKSTSQLLSNSPYTMRFANNAGQMLARNLPNLVTPMLASAIPAVIPYIGPFISLYNTWSSIQHSFDAMEKQNAIAKFERQKYDLELRIQQSANYLASNAILEEGRQYVGELENGFLKAGISMRNGTGAMQLARIEDSFRKRAMLARQGY